MNIRVVAVSVVFVVQLNQIDLTQQLLVVAALPTTKTTVRTMKTIPLFTCEVLSTSLIEA